MPDELSTQGVEAMERAAKICDDVYMEYAEAVRETDTPDSHARLKNMAAGAGVCAIRIRSDIRPPAKPTDAEVKGVRQLVRERDDARAVSNSLIAKLDAAQLSAELTDAKVEKRRERLARVIHAMLDGQEMVDGVSYGCQTEAGKERYRRIADATLAELGIDPARRV